MFLNCLFRGLLRNVWMWVNLSGRSLTKLEHQGSEVAVKGGARRLKVMSGRSEGAATGVKVGRNSDAHQELRIRRVRLLITLSSLDFIPTSHDHLTSADLS